MSHRKDMQQFVLGAEKLGCTVTYSGSGHWKIKTPSGAIIICPSTPRELSRSVKNTTARLRKAGVSI